MKFDDILKSVGLAEEQIIQVNDAMRQSKLFLTTEEKLEERYTKVKEQKEALEAELKTAQQTIDQLKVNHKDNQELQQTIETYKTEVESLKEQNALNSKKFEVELALREAGAKDAKLVQGLINLDSVLINDEGMTGLKEQVDKLKESHDYLFNEEKPKEPEEEKHKSFRGAQPGGPKKDSQPTGADLANLSYDEFLKQFNN